MSERELVSESQAYARGYSKMAEGLQFDPSAQFIRNADTGRIPGLAN